MADPTADPPSPGRISCGSSSLQPPSSIMVAATEGGIKNNNPRNEPTTKTSSHDVSVDSLLDDSSPPTKPEHKRSSVGSDGSSKNSSITSSSSSSSPTNNRSELAGGGGGEPKRGSSGGVPTKFQFYKSSPAQFSGKNMIASPDSPLDNFSRESDEANDVTVGGGGEGGGAGGGRGGRNRGGLGGGARNKIEIAKYPIPAAAVASAVAAAASFGGKSRSKKGVDPPEKELPTRYLQMQRELQLQQSGDHHPSPIPQTLTRDGSSSSYHVPLSGGRSGSEKSTSTFQGNDINDVWYDDNDDIDYPNVRMDPIESDDDFSPIHTKNQHPLAAAVASALAASQSAASPRPTPLTPSTQQPQQHPMYLSPSSLGGRNAINPQFQNTIQYPHSTKSLPHNLPPQQMMQYLHAGGSSYTGAGHGFGPRRRRPSSGGGVGGVFVSNGLVPPPFQSNGDPNQNSTPSTKRHMFQRRNSHGQQFQQQAGRPLFTRHATDYNSSHQLYSDGIDLLKKTASEAQEREEVDTLNLGINYLRKMETAMVKEDNRINHQYVIPPPPLQQHRNRQQQQQQQQQQKQYQHLSSRKAAPPSPASLAQLHPPPKLNKARSASLGVHDMQSINESCTSVWQQQGERLHRPPPATKPMSNPCTPITHNRPRPRITAVDAMRFVMNASIQPPLVRDYDGSMPVANEEITKDQDSIGMDKMQSLLVNLLQVDNGESGATNNDDTASHAKHRNTGPTQKNDDEVSTNSADQDDDDFERNTSLSMHAEDKHGLKLSKSSPAVSRKSMDPPDEAIHYDANFEVHTQHKANTHSTTAQFQEYSDEAESCAREILPHPLLDFNDADGSISTSSSIANKPSALGPRSQQPGGTTGIVLEDGLSSKNSRDHSLPTKIALERSQEEPSFSDSSENISDVDDDPQSILDESVGGEPRHNVDNYSSIAGLTCDGSDAEATSLMIKVCSHLFPDGMDIPLNNSLTSLITLDSVKLEWDDNDPDEPGYVTHRLTKSQLMGVENAFENFVAPFLQSFKKHSPHGSNDNFFQHDLEEAEVILDKEKKQFELEAGKRNISTEPCIDIETESLILQVKEIPRESIPGFPGVYPPGKGEMGDMECFYLPIITSSQKTGFEPTKDIVLKPGTLFAKNYLVQGELGSAAFSTAYRCIDLCSKVDEDGFQDEVCLKVIKNTKDYFDQSLDEIKILQLLKDTDRAKENNIVEMKSYFYHREHLVIVTELLRQNLYEFGKSIVESEGPLYFTRTRLSHIIRQCLIALKFVHELGLMHCDIKPENILLCSYSRALVKIIDFGSSSFVTDRQSSYIQSRSYRAPEVILGLPHDGKIDLWSLGCVVAEMYTNEVTFQNDSEVSMLSRIEAVCGLFPRHMIANGRNSHRIFTDCGLIYEKISSDDADSSEDETDKTLFDVYQPKLTTISARLGFDEDLLDKPHLSDDVSKWRFMCIVHLNLEYETQMEFLFIVPPPG